MWDMRISASALLVGSALLLGSPALAIQADSSQNKPGARQVPQRGQTVQIAPGRGVNTGQASASRGRYAYRGASQVGGLSCVPYARMVSGIFVTGNAWQWWGNAAGAYARGKLPETGSILAFRSNHVMRLGHVAMVSRVVGPREIMIDHANWPSDAARGNISRNVRVVDVSERNDWSAVRVQLGRSSEFGAIYPTHGFIYDRPDSGIIIAATNQPAPHPDINPVTRDLRPWADRQARGYEEVAEAPEPRARGPRGGATSGWSTTTRLSDTRN